jgi:hypothetical protein
MARFGEPIEPMTLGNMRRCGTTRRSATLSRVQSHHIAIVLTSVLAFLVGASVPIPAELEGAADAGDVDRGAMAKLRTTTAV